MRRTFTILLLALMAIFATSCKTDNFAVTYNVDVIGDADGNVTVTFPDGNLGMNGKADLNFHYGNATMGMLMTMDDAMNGSENQRKAAELIAEDYAKNFSATAASGTYYLHIDGYAEAYGVKISIDETLTNRK